MNKVNMHAMMSLTRIMEVFTFSTLLQNNATRKSREVSGYPQIVYAYTDGYFPV